MVKDCNQYYNVPISFIYQESTRGPITLFDSTIYVSLLVELLSLLELFLVDSGV